MVTPTWLLAVRASAIQTTSPREVAWAETR